MMENQIIMFNNTEFGGIRTLNIDGEPWFVGKDIAEVLGYSNTRKAIADHIDNEDKKDGVTIRDSIGRTQNPIIINESGLYSLILSSKLPSAKKFKRWVTSEVIPSIRKHGAYMTPKVIEKTLLDPDYLIQLATVLKKEQEKNKQLESKIQRDKPLVDFALSVSDTSDLIDMGQFAKLVKDEKIDIGRNRLFKWLRENGYLMSSDTHLNEPYQQYINQGLFDTKEYTYSTPYGEKVGLKTYVTGKGQIYFVEKLRKEFGCNF